MGGIGGGLFDPNGTTTRAMIVTILYRMDGSPASEQNNMFTDVQESAYYYDAVLWAYANGITGGYGNGLFGPNDAITREQMVTMLLRYATYKDLDVSAGEETNSHSSLTTAQRHSSRKPISQSKIHSGAREISLLAL